MVREIKDTSPETQEPGPGPLGRAPVQFVLVVVVVQLLGRRAFSIFVNVARRPAHALRSRRSVRCRQRCSTCHLYLLAARRTPRLAPQSIWVKNQSMKHWMVLRAAVEAGQIALAFTPQTDAVAGQSCPTGPERYVRPARRCNRRLAMPALLAYGKTLAQK